MSTDEGPSKQESHTMSFESFYDLIEGFPSSSGRPKLEFLLRLVHYEMNLAHISGEGEKIEISNPLLRQ